ncbi:hypothetical protein J6590_020431 [Homalodisca vitripennis]|nr:hypothetical protein J6590_020431 [Homalodisca vitripennis]
MVERGNKRGSEIRKRVFILCSGLNKRSPVTKKTEERKRGFNSTMESHTRWTMSRICIKLRHPEGLSLDLGILKDFQSSQHFETPDLYQFPAPSSSPPMAVANSTPKGARSL